MKTLVVDLRDRVERSGATIDPVLDMTFVDLLPLEELKPHLADTELLLTTPRLTVDDALLDAAPKLRFIQVPSTGFDRIDVEVTARRGIPASHVPGGNALSVAEHVFMVMMALQRRLVPSFSGIKAGRYQPEKNRMMAEGIYELWGKTLGIIGFGRIGREVAKRAIGFDMNVIYYDIVRPDPEEERKYNVTFVPRDELLARADILTVHVPLEKATYHLVGEAELARLKPTALVINAARGPLVDPAPLAAMVADGLLAGAAVDVFETEPAPDADPLVELARSGCERIILTPHLAGVTAESSVRGAHRALANLARVAHGQPPVDVFNGVTSPAGATA
ncbi:MAG TPA: NAD(P)-dependent oxidoreductase [Chloroflexota bacterium]|jgi:phosphoglycerate dehydrogenase-like enzyme